MYNLKKIDSKIFSCIQKELKRQEEWIELIASENYVSKAVLEALGSVLTNKYSEWYINKRYYWGCQHIDEVESLAIERAKKLFNAEHVNVQPLSWAPANIAVYFALLQPWDTVLGMDLSHGWHLTHWHPVTYMTKIFNFIRYKTNIDWLIDLNNLREMAIKNKPKLILVWYSAYSREINYKEIKKIADEVWAYTMADIAHIAWLIAAWEMNNPVPIFDVVTTTTHKTLRWPRWWMIMCKEKFAQSIDKSVFPWFQWGPHENNIAAKAVAFKEALEPSFKKYCRQIIKNAKIMEEEFKKLNYKICFWKTDNHLILIDVTTKWVSWKEVQIILDKVGITVNKNMIPDDPRSPMDPSWIRLGTPAMTTRGFKEKEFKKIVYWINEAIINKNNPKNLLKIKKEVLLLCKKFPIYS
jgi:glycine hydroxymethyltransferase